MSESELFQDWSAEDEEAFYREYGDLIDRFMRPPPEQDHPFVGQIFVWWFKREWQKQYRVAPDLGSLAFNSALVANVKAAGDSLGLAPVARLAGYEEPRFSVEFDFERIGPSSKSRTDRLLVILEAVYGYTPPLAKDAQEWRDFAGQVFEDLIASLVDTHPNMWVEARCRPVGEIPPAGTLDCLRDLTIYGDGPQGEVARFELQCKYLSSMAKREFIDDKHLNSYYDLLPIHAVDEAAFYLVVGRGGLPFFPSEVYLIQLAGYTKATFSRDFSAHQLRRRQPPLAWLRVDRDWETGLYSLS